MLSPTSFLARFAPPLLLGIAFCAWFFRGFGSEFPPGLNHDAAWHGLVALRLIGGESLGVYTPEYFGHEMPYYHVMAAMFRVFGAGKTSIELTATLFGALSVALFYALMFRQTRNGWLALGLSLLWISSSALVLFSRVGWQLISLVPAALCVAGAGRLVVDETQNGFVDDHSTRRRNPFVDERMRVRFSAILLGASCAFALYTYNGARTILLFLPLFWLVRMVQVASQSRAASSTKAVRTTLVNAALSMGVFLIISAPMLWFAAHNWDAWNGRAASLMGGNLGDKVANVAAALGYFNVSARGDDFFTDFPVLEGPMRVLWMVGIGFAVWRARTYWPELLLFALFLLPGIVTKPAFHRSIGTLPIVYLLACYALVEIGRALNRRFQNKNLKPTLAGALTLLVLFQMNAGWRKLYVEKQPFAWGFYPETTVVGNYLGAHSNRKFIVHAANWPQDALKFLSSTKGKTPGENLLNYQNYNTQSGDGLPEIARDLSNGTIARPVRGVVDVEKFAAFSAALGSSYQVREVDVLRTRDGREIARVLEIQ